MSRNPRGNPQGRNTTKIVSVGQPSNVPPPEYDYEESEEPTPQTQQIRGASPRAAQYRAPGVQSHSQSRTASQRTAPPRPRRDIFPFVAGSLIGATVAGLMVVAFLIGSMGKSAGVQTSGSSGTGGVQSVITPPSSSSSAASGVPDPPRIPMADFRKLYDNPATRPVVIDVRTKDLYDAEHIKGAISIPVGEVDALVAEIPKDKLVVAYCQ